MAPYVLLGRVAELVVSIERYEEAGRCVLCTQDRWMWLLKDRIDLISAGFAGPWIQCEEPLHHTPKPTRQRHRVANAGRRSTL